MPTKRVLVSALLVLATVAGARASAAPVTFTRDVAPIIFTRCAQCHYQGGPAPFAFETYADVKRRAGLVATATKSRLMPPWKAEPGIGDFVGQHPLSDAEIATIQEWVSEGAAEGDARDLPPPPEPHSGWQLGTPDLVVTLPNAYILPAGGSDVFRIFVVAIPLATQRYVRGLEFNPGNTRVAHHAQVLFDRTSASRRLDAEDPLPGYDGLLARSATYPDGYLLGWTPGQAASLLPAGLGWRLDPGTDLVIKLHMNPSGKPESVRPSIGFFFTDQPPTRTPVMLRLGRQNIDIHAGEARHVVTDSYELPVDVEVQAVQPHAHYRAREVAGTATLPDGSSHWLIFIKDWDFRWQHVYRLATPLTLPRGTTLAMRYVYDNSEQNPRNPQRPPERVQWGQGSLDEMGDLWIQVLTRSEDDRNALNESFSRKALAEDIVGYENLLGRDQNNPGLHDDIALLYLQAGEPEAAVAHFETSNRLKPPSAAALFNFGTALAVAGQIDDAIAQFESALRIDAAYGPAHNNLGELLLRRGNIDEALLHFRAAVAADSHNVEAHFNLAAALARRGEGREAIKQLRLALEQRPDWPSALANLSWLLASAPEPTVRDPGEAVRLAERAVALTTQRDPAALDVLAVAYAAAGQFDRARDAADDALRLGPPDPLASAIRKRRDLYAHRAGDPVGKVFW
jgi:tetratricopeptide (TPR) repeat protein